MSFASAIFLLGLPLAALPVIIHLLHRRRQAVIPWGAMRFMVEAMSLRRRIRRIEDLLLMLLRAVLIAAFIFALARPKLAGGWLGDSGPRDVVIVLDVSMSTSQNANGDTVFEQQRRQADRLIDNLAEHDVVRVMLASAGPQWLSPVPIPANTATKAELHKRLAELSPTYGTADMLRCVREAITEPAVDDDATRVVVVLTDGQAYGWRAAAGSAWRQLAKESSHMPAPPIVKVVNLSPGERPVANVAVRDVTATRTVAAAGDLLTVTAVIANTGDWPVDATLVAWSVGDTPIGATTMPALAPGQTTSVRIEHQFDDVGVFDVACRIDLSDELAMDNTGACVVEVVDNVPILVVASEPSRDPARTETGFLLAALGCDGRGRRLGTTSAFRPKCIRADALGDQRLSDYHCVVLADVGALPDSVMQSLGAYVRNGGGLWIALGDQVRAESFNASFHAGGRGLAPLRLAGEPVGDAADHETFIEVHPPLTRHLATLLLADTERLDIDWGHIYRRHRFVQPRDRQDVSVLLTAGDRELLAVEHTHGKGRIIVQAVPLGVQWSNLPLLQSYVVMAHEWLWYLVEPTARRWSLNVGEPLRVSFPIDPATEPAEPDLSLLAATVTSPQSDETEVVPTLDAGRLVYEYRNTLVPGRYGFRPPDADAAVMPLPFYVVRDPDESDLKPLAEQDVTFLASSGGLAFGADATSATQSALTPSRPAPVWSAVLFSLFALMLFELTLGTLTNRRRRTRSPGLAMDVP